VSILTLIRLLTDRDIHAGILTRKMCLDLLKNHACGQKKKQKPLALLYLASGPVPNAAISSDVPTKFAEKHNKGEVLEGKFRNF